MDDDPSHPSAGGPSSLASAEETAAPVFKKRNRTAGGKTGRIVFSSSSFEGGGGGGGGGEQPSTDGASSSTVPPESSNATSHPIAPEDDQEGEEESSAPPLSDLLALRTLSRRPGGIALDKLNAGETRKKKKTKKKALGDMTREERWEEQMRRGGLVAQPSSFAEEEEEEGEGEGETEAGGGGGGKRLLRQDNFQSETGTVDVDKHMMAYIESELSKRRAHPSTSSSSSAGNNGPSSAGDSTTSATTLSEADLYRLSERYQALQKAARSLSGRTEKTQDEEEGNVTLSTAMLSSIPEIDLGMDARMRNIEQTEKAKRSLAATRTGAGGEKGERDEGFAAARFFRPNYTRTDADASRHRNQQHQQGGSGGGTSGAATAGGARREMASDQLVLDRFKKRQRTFR